MKKTITSRIEILLAKLAGQDVSLSTMAPGVPINLSEKLMLDIADRLDKIEQGGGGGGAGSGGKIVTIKQEFDESNNTLTYVNLKTPKVGDVESNEVIARYGGTDEPTEMYMYDGDFSDFGTFDNPAIVQVCQYGSGEIGDMQWYNGASSVQSVMYYQLGPSSEGTEAYSSDTLVLTEITPSVYIEGKVNGENFYVLIIPSDAAIAAGTYGQDDGDNGGGGDVYD